MTQSHPTPVEVNTFCEIMMQVDDKGAAFRAAFPKSKASRKTTNEKGCRLASYPAVRTKIAELQEIARHVVTPEFTVTIADKKRLLASVARQGLDKGKSLSAVVAAVSELNRMDGHHEPPKAPVGPDGGLAPTIVMSPEEFKKLRAEVVAHDDC